jgi:hypothetical protein
MLLRGSQETSAFVLFLGGTANPEGVRQLTDKAEARRAASAQVSFPSRRAREKTVPEKVMRMTAGGQLKYEDWSAWADAALRRSRDYETRLRATEREKLEQS